MMDLFWTSSEPLNARHPKWKNSAAEHRMPFSRALALRSRSGSVVSSLIAGPEPDLVPFLHGNEHGNNPVRDARLFFIVYVIQTKQHLKVTLAPTL